MRQQISRQRLLIELVLKGSRSFRRTKTAVPRATRLFGALFSARVLPAGCVFDLQMQYAI